MKAGTIHKVKLRGLFIIVCQVSNKRNMFNAPRKKQTHCTQRFYAFGHVAMTATSVIVFLICKDWLAEIHDTWDCPDYAIQVRQHIKANLFQYF